MQAHTTVRWTDCHNRGEDHDLTDPKPVEGTGGKFAFGIVEPSTRQKCRKCRVTILNVPR